MTYQPENTLMRKECERMDIRPLRFKCFQYMVPRSKSASVSVCEICLRGRTGKLHVPEGGAKKPRKDQVQVTGEKQSCTIITWVGSRPGRTPKCQPDTTHATNSAESGYVVLNQSPFLQAKLHRVPAD
ncbi:hypothetical protein CEXT_382911 [Caerostris extrusa]|uniref:Uncharacterized protein n=1 Tax=Caerostris extrusa TaxID=172846 RepID=A0AAV4W0Q2_CAEEX|nr:hypothetical protein CEXT_382911 [Caerostris extrusa]